MKKQFLTMALSMAVLCSGVAASYACDCVCGCSKQMNPSRRIQKAKLAPEEFQTKIQEKRQAHFDRFAKFLELTDEQKIEIKQIKENSDQKIKPLSAKKIEKIKSIRDIKRNDDLSIKAQDKKIESIKSELKVIDQEIRQVKQDERKAFNAILTDEQKDKLVQMKNTKNKKHRPMPRACMY